jgi:hypothetical protein
MANFMFNIGKGRLVQLYKEVEDNSPNANAAFILVPLSQSGTEAQGQDLDDLAAVEADANFAERTTGGWVRKVLESVELAALPTPDDTNNRYEISLPQVTWTTPAAGNNTTGLLLCYDADTTAGTDSAIIPLAHFDFVVTTDGNDVVLNAGPAFRAT